MNIICYIAKSCYEFYTTFFGKIVLYFYIFLISLTTALEDGNGLNKFIKFMSGESIINSKSVHETRTDLLCFLNKFRIIAR